MEDLTSGKVRQASNICAVGRRGGRSTAFKSRQRGGYVRWNFSITAQPATQHLDLPRGHVHESNAGQTVGLRPSHHSSDFEASPAAWKREGDAEFLGGGERRAHLYS